MDRFVVTSILCALSLYASAQCSTLSTSISVDFSANGVCAPVTVNMYDVTYTFNVAQNPNDIEIEFRWNDPAATTETIDIADLGVQFFVSNGDRTYQALATAFPYPPAGVDCFYDAQAIIIVAGDDCESSEQTQIVPSWNRDDQNGGVIATNPGTFDVCFDNAITNATFTDASTFNCNIVVNPTTPNELERHTQFVYGTNYVAGDIRDLTLVDVVPVVVTDGVGNLAAPDTRGTAGLMVTAGYFGPVVNIPFPAQVPVDVSFPISAPANALNLVGATFEVTLFNWNTCNPYNGDPLNPNYDEAISTTANVNIIAPPAPSFVARDGGSGGPIGTEFCINSDVFFDNGTVGPYTYLWEFYDGPADTDPLLGTSTLFEPTFQFANSGMKLVRLIATNGAADGNCDVNADLIIDITPDAVADFDIEDDLGVIISPNPSFCDVDGTFQIFFIDNTSLEPNTEYLFEFYDQASTPGVDPPFRTQPFSGTPSTSPIVPFDSIFLDTDINFGPSLTQVRLTAQSTTGNFCFSEEIDSIFIYDQPEPTFAADEVCEGDLTSFSNIVDEIAGIPIRINNDIINLYEWDFDYDGVTFTVDLTVADNNDFTRNMGAANTYNVGLRVTTQLGGCVSQVFELPVVVNPNPDSQLAHDAVGQLCPGDLITFTNNSNNPSLIMQYFLEVSHPPTAYFQSTTLTTMDTMLSFPNPDDSIRTYQAVIRAQTDDGCETLSSVETFQISSDENAAFSDLNYDVFSSNCSLWTSTLLVDAATQALAPDMYEWTLSEGGGVLAGYPVTKVSTDPDFHQLDYSITNTTNAIRAIEAVLEVTKAGVCIENDTFNLQISPQPSSDFTLLRDEDCDEVVLELEATQKGLTDYAWVFNPVPDNEFGFDDQRLISYTREATTGSDFNVTVSLVTTNLAGCPSDMTDIMETVERRKPDLTADFTLSSDTVQLPDATVTITNISTPDAGYTYEWDFGDGGTSDVRDPGSYTYTNFGSFLIRLTIMDEFCDVDTAKSIVVLPADPVIDFEADTLQGCTPLTIQFTNLSQSAVSGEFLWEFGDGSISNLDNPLHTYFDGGTYDVRLRGTNNVGVTMETEKMDYIEAFGRPFADFLVSSRIVFIPDDEVHFRNLSENSVEFFWDFGDGATSTESDPSHAYTDEGTYDIMLVATNELGCVDTLFRAAEIEAVVGGDVSSPNAFTPNTSGPSGGEVTGGLNLFSVNDIFLPRLEGVINFRMLIYNKWGQLIFESENQNIGWDGYYKGRLAPAGVYIYKLELRYSDDRDDTKVGDVTLIR